MPCFVFWNQKRELRKKSLNTFSLAANFLKSFCLHLSAALAEENSYHVVTLQPYMELCLFKYLNCRAWSLELQVHIQFHHAFGHRAEFDLNMYLIQLMVCHSFLCFQIVVPNMI